MVNNTFDLEKNTVDMASQSFGFFMSLCEVQLNCSNFGKEFKKSNVVVKYKHDQPHESK